MSAQAVLFDAPGPRARARHRILTVLGALLVLAVAFVVVRKMNDAGQLDSALWTPFLTDPAVWSEYLLLGLWATVKAAVFSIALAGRSASCSAPAGSRTTQPCAGPAG